MRRLSFPDLMREAVAEVAARPSRLILTVLGTLLGIAALVATLGLGQTAAGQVEERFDAVAATRVTVLPEQREGRGGEFEVTRLPWDSPERVERLAGVTSAGIFAWVDVGGKLVRGTPVTEPGATSEHDIGIAAASPGLFPALQADLSAGRFFDGGHDERGDPVVVLGKYAAERLGITGIEAQPAIFIGDRPYPVIGIIDGVAHRSALMDAVIMPVGTAREVYGLTAPQEVEIRTQVGAPQQVGRQVPLALSPNSPDLVDVKVPPPPGQTRRDVAADVNVLFLAFGALALLVGGLGIANVTLLSVLQRVPEIGVRRAVGASRLHIAGQFMVESTIIGLLGGLIGAAAGVGTTVVVSALREWTPLLDIRLALAAPLLGAAIGLVAGAYPAWRAATVEPITALRSA